MKKLLLMLFLLTTSLIAAETPPPSLEPYEAKDFSNILGMPGFTDEALKMHFTLYQGYVKNTNLFIQILDGYAKEGKERTPQYAEIKRRLGWEFDGMRLHELYFSNLGGTPDSELDPDSPLCGRIEQDFGTFAAWQENFKSTGLMRGIGWVVLYLDPVEGRLLNMWIAEHDIGHMAGGKPILILDVWEHAYLTMYGLDRAAYIDAFFNNVNWQEVANRFPKDEVPEKKTSRT
ncbi:MAG: Superoxide dismutase [Fe] [Chlamydiae bacterium]|nr:Superoxide dismutase [Fe] [Chlamydiota bacterium]